MKKAGIIITAAILAAITAYTVIQMLRCENALTAKKKQLEECDAKMVELNYGNMSYIDKGEGVPILSVHGIFGGYDQAYETCRAFESKCRIIAPSRFGYLGSDILGSGTPAQQAKAYAELLDFLAIDKVFVLATSAGGSVAIRFALDYPERTRGLILYCSAMPLKEKPKKYSEYAGPPPFLCNDRAMFIISPLFETIMGMNTSTVYDMLPIEERKQGVILDASVTNPDMARNFDAYPIESLKTPTLILHSRDDKLASFEDVTNALKRFPDCTLVAFDNGGHLMKGHEQEVKDAVEDFIKRN